ncbi:beta-L-arabinofuranosidase domain-containing protein [Amedibacillus sp. YH-ame10]
MNAENIARIEKDIETLYLGNLKTVEFNLDLPTEGKHGSTITWKSSDERYITDGGIVHQLAYGKGNRDLTLTATFRIGEDEKQKQYPVTVLQEPNKIKVKKLYDIEVQAVVNEEVKIPTVAIVISDEDKTISHSVTWDEGDTRTFDTIGSYEIHGVLTDTSIDVQAVVNVLECIKKEEVHVQKMIDAFARNEVSLDGASSFKKQQDLMLEVLLAQDDDQMLYNFREACGIDKKGAPAMVGWDTPDGNLRGHTSGHYLSALAACYSATKNEKIKEKAIYMVDSLLECQNKFETMEGFHAGFLSAYSERQFDLLEKFTPYPEIWAPYYTLHKIVAGLIDCYEEIQIENAYVIADRLGDWIYNRLSRLDNKTLKKMWSIYIAGEFGGMNESLAELYKLTNKEHHLAAAKMFDNDKLFYPLTHKVDALGGIHANQHIPQIIGAMKLFEVSNEISYYQIAKYFWEIVTKAHCYTIGGTGETEMFHQPYHIGSLLSDHSAESCASYNMLKLTKELFKYEPNVQYMDYYERTMGNHILSSGEKRPTGASTYFMPLRPGGKKSFDVENSCCHGTGLENHFRYGDAIYYHNEDTLYVNLYLSSTVSFQGATLSQEVDENKPGHVQLHVKQTKGYTLKLRVPYWANDTYIVSIDDKQVQLEKGKDGYLAIPTLAEEANIVIDFACTYYLESTPDKKELLSLHYGPYVLAALDDTQDFLSLSMNKEDLASQFTQDKEQNIFHDTVNNIDFVPFASIDKEQYHVYFKIK